MAKQRVISADSHVQEPPELYERLPKGMRERAPRKVERDGKTYIEADGRKPRRIDLAEARITADDRHRESRHDPEGGPCQLESADIFNAHENGQEPTFLRITQPVCVIIQTCSDKRVE